MTLVILFSKLASSPGFPLHLDFVKEHVRNDDVQLYYIISFDSQYWSYREGHPLETGRYWSAL